MPDSVHIAILDDHQSVVDGYCFRLGSHPGFEIVGTLHYGDELEPFLEQNPTDVLILDVNVPTAPRNANPYPILHLMRRLLDQYPDLNILVISMHNQRTLIQAVMDAGASGYIVKDDCDAIRELDTIVSSIAKSGVYFSQQALQQLAKRLPEGDGSPQLTPRQLEVLSLCAAFPGNTTSELARQLGIEHSTVRNILSSIYLRLGVSNRAAALAKARQEGIITANLDPPEDL